MNQALDDSDGFCNESEPCHKHPRVIPDNVRALKPVEVVPVYTPEAFMDILREIREAQVRIEKDIEAVKGIGDLVMDNVKPTLDMLTNGPIGQILGIAPPPSPRIGRRHR